MKQIRGGSHRIQTLAHSTPSLSRSLPRSPDPENPIARSPETLTSPDEGERERERDSEVERSWRVTVETRLKPTELQLARNPYLNSTQKKREEGNWRPDGDLAAYGRNLT